MRKRPSTFALVRIRCVLVLHFSNNVAIKLVTNVEQMWDVECLMATNRSFVLMPYSTQLLQMKFSGYIIWNSLSFCILPTSTHNVTIFPFPLHYFNYSFWTPKSRIDEMATVALLGGPIHKARPKYFWDFWPPLPLIHILNCSFLCLLLG